MVTVTQNPDVKDIQDDIAKELGMQLEENERITWRARFLHDRLKTQHKVILILLDDLWNELNLEEVGIPKQNGFKSYKIVIATRNEAVCRIMETDRELYVPVLSEHESWTLFRKKVGDVVDSADINTIAKEVVDECAGLPLAIVLLGRALRKKTNACVWADTLRRLKKSINENLGRVYSSIKLSYDFLPSEVHKKCFLFCSLFPEDYNIDVRDKLLVYVVGEKLLEDGVDCLNNLEETKWRLDNIVEDLISSSLLLRGYRVGYTKMHDVVRDVAKRIASEDKEYKQHTDAVQTDLMRWPEQLESCKRLSLMRTKIRCNIPRQVEAPQLLTLILTASEGFNELPCDFFKKMKNLRNLNLSDTEIASLPPSISCLVELRTLRLTRCSSLQNISPVEKLLKLEILDLGQSGIERLPEEMGMLTNLKSLNITFMEDLKSISPKVISSMYQLEELYAHSFQGWEIGEMGGKINANLSEVASLANLTCLRIHIPGMECFSTSTPIHWGKLEEFTVCVTDCTDQLIAGFQRRLYLEIPSSISVPNEVIWLLNKADFVKLYKCNDLETVVQVDPTGGFKENNLKWLDVRKCSKMKYLISNIEVEKSPEISFSSLEHLHFWDLENLESICNGKTLPHGFLHSLRDLFFTSCRRLICLINLELQNLGNTSASSCSMLSIFSNLRNLRLKGCDKIRYVLPMSVARYLNQLVYFCVINCPSIKMIIANDNGEDDGDKYILPRLKCLELRKLPALLSFGRPGFVFDWDSLTQLYLFNCGNLKSLPCKVTQQRLSNINCFGLDETLINLLEDPSIIDNLEHHVLVDNSFFCKKRD
ncbi:Disease resistance protein [Thalictrum thalictroides]|uniref:Disease resistance protein n=1 Tax=Thalictrum thalictroides TaxID=46969 RepID=A0A7J6WNZ8_THATH|nr:Disease resistance protein [Thalictrum thalictroides]